MKLSGKKLNISKQSLVFAALFVLSFAFMLWKCPYGFGGSDEAFYLTVPHRLTLGDELFRDEWHLSQLASFFTLPFVSAYRHFDGSNDGIMLAARYTYTVIHALAALVIYLRLRHFGWLSVAGSIIYMLFTPFDMMSYSYNTVALDTLALAGVLAGTSDGRRAPDIAAGALFACAVVCCPYLVTVYALYLVMTALYAVLYRKTWKRTWQNPLLTWRCFGRVTVGIMITAALFAVFFFRHSSIADVAAALPGLFTDPEHPGYSVVFMLKHYVYCLVTAHRLIYVPLGIYALSLAWLIFDKKHTEHAHIHLSLAALSALVCFLLFSKELTQSYYNGIMLPLAFVGFTAYLLLDDKPRGLFAAHFMLGLLYSVCVCATSNMGFDVMSMAFSVVNIASCVFIALLLRQMARSPRSQRRLVLASGIAPVVCLALLVVTVKAAHCFWDAPPAWLTVRIEAGPARGIVTSQRLNDDYMRVYDDLAEYRDEPRGNILVYAQETWCYLILDDYPYAGFSAWLSGLDSVTELRLRLYYELNSGKYPQYVYILKDNAFAAPQLDGARIYAEAEANGFSVEENDVSWKLTRK